MNPGYQLRWTIADYDTRTRMVNFEILLSVFTQ